MKGTQWPSTLYPPGFFCLLGQEKGDALQLFLLLLAIGALSAYSYILWQRCRSPGRLLIR